MGRLSAHPLAENSFLSPTTLVVVRLRDPPSKVPPPEPDWLVVPLPDLLPEFDRGVPCRPTARRCKANDNLAGFEW